MEPKQLAEIAKEVLENKNGADTTIIQMSQPAIADYFIVTTAKNRNHLRALAEELADKLYAVGIQPTRSEGVTEGRWAVLDYDSVIVHIFSGDERDFYCLEKLWGEKK